jgi:hypothetical protein
MVGGSIPTELGNLQRLKFLDFSNSSMTGSIPREFGELNKLGTFEWIVVVFLFMCSKF